MTLTLADIQSAQSMQQGLINDTPMLSDEALPREVGARTFLKAECLQRSGSFKIRGAYNKIHHLTPEEHARGVIAASAGNHAQGVAFAAKLHGIQATLVMPDFAPLTKIMATQELGAEVVLEGASFDDAAAHALALQEEHGFANVHPFDDELVIAGQGTLGLEIVEELPEVSVVVVPVGGGGLISGISTAVKALRPETRVIGVQAAGGAAVRPSLEAGHPVQISVVQTIADGIAVKCPGALTLPIIRDLVDEMVEVTDDEIAQGIAHCAQSMMLVVEGAGAAGMAALLSGKVNLESSDTVCAVLSGGNIDGNLLTRVIQQEMVRQGRYILLKLAVVDRPGVLSTLMDVIADVGANVIDIFHRRAMWLAPLRKVGLEVVLEVRNETHGREVIEHLEHAGYHVERERQGLWPT